MSSFHARSLRRLMRLLDFCVKCLRSFSYGRQQVRPIFTSKVLSQEIIDVEGPVFAESISEGDIRWLKQKGDFVKADELVAEIETDKTTVEVPAPQSGVLQELLVSDGDKVTAKQLLYRLRLTGEAPSGPAEADAQEPGKDEVQDEALEREEPKPAREKPKPSEPPPELSEPPAEPAGHPSLAPETPPKAPKPTRAKSTSLPAPKVQSQMVPFQAVTPEEDQKGYATGITGDRTEYRVKINRMRARIAQRLKDAQNTYAMLTTFNEVDMSAIVQMRKKHNEAFQKKYGVKLGFMSPFIKAAAYALQDQPIVNAVIDQGEIVYRRFIDISVAVASPRGLVVPVLRNVESMGFADVEKSIAHFAELAMSNKLAIEDMEGGTFTISNGGVFGSLFGTPIINPPQSAILGMHAIVDKPTAVDGKIEIRPMMYICLTYDHRLIDGREAVTFLRTIKRAIENPSVMLLGL